MPGTVAVDRFEDVLARCGVRDRASVERHLAACDAEEDPAHGRLWRKLVIRLSTLAPMNFTASGAHVVLFFVADGKYRMQVFAIEDARDGVIRVYLTDIIKEAIRDKIISKNGDQYVACDGSGAVLQIDALDGVNTVNPAAHYKHMLGWNRKAMRVTLPTTAADGPQVDACEKLCILAAKPLKK